MAQYNTYYYEEGSAARQIDRGVLPTREDRERELAEQKRREKRERMRAHRRAKLAGRRMSVGMAFSAILIGAYFVAYVHIQNQITTSMDNISGLEKQIAEIKTENAALKSRISTTANLAKIQKTAINELGMVYATSKQIVYYSVDDDDYMSQYEQVE